MGDIHFVRRSRSFLSHYLLVSFMLVRRGFAFQAQLTSHFTKLRTFAIMTKSDDVSTRKGILMILSPAKTLDLSPTLPAAASNLQLTLPNCSPEKTTEIARAMKNLSNSEITKLLKLSTNLAKTTAEYWKRFEVDASNSSQNNRKPCIYAYSGAAYQGLQASHCSAGAILYLQDNLRILDAVYGVLRPLDQIQPYRLELSIKNVLPDTKLANYWSDAVTSSLAVDLQRSDDKEPILLNLASEEYSAVVDASQLQCSYIKAVFCEDGRVVTVHAKRARGLMARYLSEHQVSTIAGIQKFAEEGYRFLESKSDDTTLVFDRPKQPKAAAAKRSTKGASETASVKRLKR